MNKLQYPEDHNNVVVTTKQSTLEMRRCALKRLSTPEGLKLTFSPQTVASLKSDNKWQE